MIAFSAGVAVGALLVLLWPRVVDGFAWLAAKLGC